MKVIDSIHHAAQLLSVNNYQLRMDAKRFECWERSYAAQLALRQINTSTVPFSANPVSSEKRHHPALLRSSLLY